MRGRTRGRVRTSGLIWSGLRANWWTRGLVVVLVVGAAVLVPGAAAAAVLAYVALRRKPDHLLGWLLVGVGLVLAALVALVGGSYWSAVTHLDVARVVAQSAVLGPLVGGVWWLADQAWRERQPMAGPAEADRRRRIESARRRTTVHRVQRVAFGSHWPGGLRQALALAALPLWIRGGVVLGSVLDGDLPWPRARVRRDLLVLPFDRRQIRHLVVLGSTGTGKSEITFRAVEAEILRGREGDQVIYLNCKQPGQGDEPALRLATAAEEAGKSFRCLIRDSSPWDPMRGTPDQIRQRLLATQEWGDSYYEHVSNLIIGLALDLAEREGRPLETLPELVWSLLRDRLRGLAAHDPAAGQLVEMLGDQETKGAVLRWASNALYLRGWIGPRAVGGWSWEDADVIAVDLPTNTEPSAARMLLRAMLTDLFGWISDPARRPKQDGVRRPVTLVIEEVSALDDDPILGKQIKNLLERARSAQVRVIVVAQGPAGLGDERVQEAMLTNTAVITCRQTDTDAVERLSGQAGTHLVEEASVAYDGVLSKGVGSIRLQHAFKVRPDAIRALGQGEVFVIHQGRWAHVAVAMSPAGYREPTGPAVEQLREQLEQARTPVATLTPEVTRQLEEQPQEHGEPRRFE